MTRLRQARATLLGRKAKVATRTRRVLDPEKQAGPANVNAALTTLAGLGGKATQATLTERTGMNSGTMSHALQALVRRGSIRATGVSVRRSLEYEVVTATTVRAGQGRRRAAA